MNIKKLLVVLISIIFLTGCTNINDFSYDDILNLIGKNIKSTNVYRNGYKFYLPKGMNLEDASFNYAIVSSLKSNYYVYFDLIAYNQNKLSTYEINPNAVYSKKILNNDIDGYMEINLQENNQYLIEIMYNYAKIEVMVDKDEINEVLINSINILNSIKYDSIVIEKLLKDDKLNYTEEIFDMFAKKKNNSNILNYSETTEDVSSGEIDIKDTDFLN